MTGGISRKRIHENTIPEGNVPRRDFDTNAPAIEVNGLDVHFGKIRAVDGMSLEFSGRSLGILGPNGAGKSTLLRTLLGIIKPKNGTAKLFGHDAYADRIHLRRLIGYVPERDCHIPGMSAVDYVTLGGELTGMTRSEAIQRAHEMLHFCGLGEARYRPVDGYSTGMKQRVKLAQALVHDPPLLFLDEPTNGLDPDGRTSLLNILHDLQAKKDIRVILSSHLLHDVEYVCEEVAVVKEGRIVRHDSIDVLKRISERHWHIRIRGEVDRFIAAVSAAGGRIEPDGKDAYNVETPEGLATNFILEMVTSTGCQLREITPYQHSLEAVFIALLERDQDGGGTA